jgi:hypothetical protein
MFQWDLSATLPEITPSLTGVWLCETLKSTSYRKTMEKEVPWPSSAQGTSFTLMKNPGLLFLMDFLLLLLLLWLFILAFFGMLTINWQAHVPFYGASCVLLCHWLVTSCG